MHERAKSVCFIYMQPQKVKFKSVQINMKQVSYSTVSLYETAHETIMLRLKAHASLCIYAGLPAPSVYIYSLGVWNSM